MTHPRLSLAFDAPDALPPSGRIAVFGPRADTDLSDLPAERVQIIQGFKPDHDAWLARGFDTATTPTGDFTAALIFLPRSKSEARAQIAAASALLPAGGPIWIDGAKTDGVESMLRELRARAAPSAPISKAHGKIFCLPAGDFTDWAARDLTPAAGFITRAGVFSAEEIDEGSALLAACLPDALPARIADLGAGWGWLSAQILARQGVQHLDLIEADATALDCARKNITDPRAAFHWADATQFAPAERYGAVIMNPPFHTARAADPALGLAFIRAAQSMLSLSGTLWMVANRHLPYDDTLRAGFHEIEDIIPPTGPSTRFRIIRASKPLSARDTRRAADAAEAKPRPRVARRPRR